MLNKFGLISTDFRKSLAFGGVGNFDAHILLGFLGLEIWLNEMRNYCGNRTKL